MSEFTGLGIVQEEKEDDISIRPGSLTDSEVLLPPLPSEHGLQNSQPQESSPILDPSFEYEESMIGSDFSNLISEKSGFVDYELSSPTMPTNIQTFPTITSTGPKEKKESPMRRLKSLKNFVGKLSINNSQTKMSPRPPLTPLQTFHSKESSHDSSSTFDSYLTKSNRSRTYSTPTSITSTYPSPALSVGDVAVNTKKYMKDIEQRFLSDLTIERFFNFDEKFDDKKVTSVDDLKDQGDLIRYSMFLEAHKKSLSDSFELTKSRLLDSGWCSDNDLQNIQLQQDATRSEIDTRLLQLDEKLKKCLHESFDERSATNSRTSSTSMSRHSISSANLKVLESKASSLADI